MEDVDAASKAVANANPNPNPNPNPFVLTCLAGLALTLDLP